MTWERLPIKRLGDVFLGKMIQPTQRAVTDVAAPYLRAAHVQPQGRIVEVDDKQMWFGREELDAHDLLADDVVIVEGGAGYGRSAVIRKDLNGWGFQNSIVRVRPRPAVACGRFIDYAIQAALCDGEIEATCFTATIPHFTADKVGAFCVPAPPLAEQRVIADFLDRETARIDTLIAEIGTSIALSGERRSAVITAAVTGQIDVTSSAAGEAGRQDHGAAAGGGGSVRQYASYVATGSQWLDSIPAHWKMGRLDHAARAWPSNVDKHSVEGELPVRLCNYTDVYKNDVIADGIPFMSATATEEQVERFRIKIGDTIITKDSETADDIGIPAFVDYEADDLVCGYHLSIVRPDPAGFFPKYLFWALRAQPTLGQWEVLASGVTRVGLRSGDVSKAALALPPLDEQSAIAEYLDRETARIDTLIAEQRKLIEHARERRSALITAAVTGQIDVREEH